MSNTEEDEMTEDEMTEDEEENLETPDKKTQNINKMKRKRDNERQVLTEVSPSVLNEKPNIIQEKHGNVVAKLKGNFNAEARNANINFDENAGQLAAFQEFC